jgi:CRP-like cAMP-binding protein
MISPELLRRYPFFGPFNDAQLRTIAMMADEISVEQGKVLFEECGPADTLYLLLEGSIDLYYKAEEEYHPKGKKEFLVGEINPGEIFSISALIHPYVLSATARAAQVCRIVKIDAAALRSALEEDPRMGYLAMQQITKALVERLAYTRVQLAAAWSEFRE